MLMPRRVTYPLLRRALHEDVTIAPAADAEAIDALPLVTFRTTINEAISDAEPPIAWDATTIINVFAEDEDTAEAICAAVYTVYHECNDPWMEPRRGLIPGYALVVEVTDRDGFDQVGSAAIQGRNVVQYSGAFGHQVHAVGD